MTTETLSLIGNAEVQGLNRLAFASTYAVYRWSMPIAFLIAKCKPETSQVKRQAIREQKSLNIHHQVFLVKQSASVQRWSFK